MKKSLFLLLAPFLLTGAQCCWAQTTAQAAQQNQTQSEAVPNLSDAPVKGTTPLMIASKNNDLKTVRALLDQGANPNEADVDGGTALMDASNNGHTKVVKLLLQAGANPNQMTARKVTPLLLAALNGHLKIINLLLKCHFIYNDDPYRKW